MGSSILRIGGVPWPSRFQEPAGLDRTRAAVDFAFSLPGVSPAPTEREMRIVLEDGGRPAEVPAQFYEVKSNAGAFTGRVLFFLDIAANTTKALRLYYGNPKAAPPAFSSGLTVTQGPAGPQHYLIENEFYKIETMPKSGQIWHVWNKLGTNTSWHQQRVD